MSVFGVTALLRRISQPGWIAPIPGETVSEKWLRNLHNLYYQLNPLTHKNRAEALGFIQRITDPNLKAIARNFLPYIEQRIRTGESPRQVAIRFSGTGAPRPLTQAPVGPTPALEAPITSAIAPYVHKPRQEQLLLLIPFVALFIVLIVTKGK